MFKTSMTMTVHHACLHGAGFLQKYVKEAVGAWKNGYHPDDERRKIKKVTFEKRKSVIDTNIKFMKVTLDDDKFNLRAGDIVIVNTNYFLYPEKVICVGKLEPRNGHSLDVGFKLEKIKATDLQNLPMDKSAYKTDAIGS